LSEPGGKRAASAANALFSPLEQGRVMPKKKTKKAGSGPGEEDDEASDSEG
jgi:hypothetical protein